MQIPDVGTAGILYRLFKHLSDYGVVMVATSNRCPRPWSKGAGPAAAT
jgi:predicted ATPase